MVDRHVYDDQTLADSNTIADEGFSDCFHLVTMTLSGEPHELLHPTGTWLTASSVDLTELDLNNGGV